MSSLQVAIAMIRNEDDGKLLFQERAKRPYKGYLGLVGGKLERGESRNEALIREVKEETSLDVRSFEYIQAIYETLISKNESVHVTLHLYAANVRGGLAASSIEGDVHWVDENHFHARKELYIPTDWLIVSTFLSNKKLFREILVVEDGEGYAIKSTN